MEGCDPGGRCDDLLRCRGVPSLHCTALQRFRELPGAKVTSTQQAACGRLRRLLFWGFFAFNAPAFFWDGAPECPTEKGGPGDYATETRKPRALAQGFSTVQPQCATSLRARELLTCSLDRRGQTKFGC